MSTDSVDRTTDPASNGEANSIGRIVSAAIGIVAVFAAAYLVSSTLLTEGYDAATVASRIGLAALAALVAAGSLLWSKRSD